MFHYNGKPAIGLAVAMNDGGNIQEFGSSCSNASNDLTAQLPVGVGVHMVSDQAQVVEVAVGGFTSALFEAVIIVLAVSFISLGLRAGLVVAISIPLVLALVFVFMEFTGIAMQRVSLGALIIALGLLVDDAMITVEMMIYAARTGRNQGAGGHVCLPLHGLPDAHRYAGDGGGVCAHRPQQQLGGGVHLHPVRGDCRGHAGVVGGGGAVRAGAGRAYPQRQGQTQARETGASGPRV
jgi:hypothetical protein